MRNLFSVFLLISTVLLIAAQANAQLVVIANLSVRAGDVSKSDLRDVFTGVSARLRDGSQVTPILLKQGPTNGEFLSTYVGQSESVFIASWRNQVFSGQASMPKSLGSEAAVVQYVAHTAGAIGYISRTTPHDGVRVLSVR